jgi:hypothetical protein
VTLRVFILYVEEIGTLFVVKTKRYYHCCMDSLDNGYSPQPDVTWAEMFVFLANNNTNNILLMRPNDTLLGRSGPVLHCLLQQHDEMKEIFKHTEMGSTGWKKITRLWKNTGCV